MPFPSPTQKVKSETQLCLTLSDPMDCSPSGSSIHGICQARVLEWGAIAFSETGAYFEFNVILYLSMKDASFELLDHCLIHSGLSGVLPGYRKSGLRS